MQITLDDLTGPEIHALLGEHLRQMAQQSPPESMHALDIDALRRPEVSVWTAWSDGQLLGCAALKELSPRHGEIKSMRTAASHRRQGVARALLRHVVQEARTRSYERVSLETGSMQAFEPARRLYESSGFSYCPPFAGYRDDPLSVFMTQRL